VSGPPISRESRETAAYRRRGGGGALAKFWQGSDAQMLWVGQMESPDGGEMGGVFRWPRLCAGRQMVMRALGGSYAEGKRKGGNGEGSGCVAW
jgi:hypothetical protein